MSLPNTVAMWVSGEGDAPAIALSHEVVGYSKTLQSMIEDGITSTCSEEAVPLQVPVAALTATVQYLERYATDTEMRARFAHLAESECVVLVPWEADWLAAMSPSLICDLILCATYLHIPSLRHVAMAGLVAHMTVQSPKELRETFHMADDLLPAEKAQLQREHALLGTVLRDYSVV